MDTRSIAPLIKSCFGQIETKLEDARQIAKAAEACAEAGRVNEAVQVSMGIEQLVYDVDRLHDAAVLLGQMIAGDR
ncbi:hypothetical protein [Bradyrhizobium sp. RDT46]|uniref:hypothetical protein n=1 Tax=Bradyrhizobium sp. RDT46 TaxID=3341829 RepID=UPI0035C6A82A